MIDSHLHLEAFEKPEEIIKESSNYMTALITSVADPKDAKLVLDLREKYKNFVFACLGFHPECIRNYSDREILDYIGFIKNVKNKICGIGEVGLDYSEGCKDINKDKMKEIFVYFIELAKELKLPLVLHTRDAFEDTLKILENRAPEKVIFHCFTGSEEVLEKILEKENYFISLATNIVYIKRLRRLIEKIPLERLILETDSPWLDPESPRTLTNRPWKIKFSADLISQIKKIPFEEVIEKTSKNTIKLFSLNLVTNKFLA